MTTEQHVFVSGASGFIGRSLCLELARRGHIVHALCRNITHPFLPQHNNIRFFRGDILEKETLSAAMEGCVQVYHTAALAKMWCKNTDDFYQVNVTGTRHVLEAAVRQNIHRIVYTSTCGVWGPTVKYPMSEDDPRIGGFPIHYERTKYLAELEVRKWVQSGLDVVIVNPSRVYGEGPVTDSNTVSKMVSGYLKGRWRVIPGTGENVANYAFLDDVVQGHLKAMLHGEAGERYILGGEDISFNQFFGALARLSGHKRRLFHVPVPVIKAYSRFEKLKSALTGLPPHFLPEFADRLNADQKYSSTKAITRLGYQITPFAEGLKRTIEHIQNH
ncbi:SDR family oxidoreductase [Pedobacter sp. SYP-B3415]|uniref:SDR family oxidoreductase n=1 Tax=Pedobacter sp. SYP-B3415 TaxID=2496641 RepID=UPI00101BBD57|nr:SDR family oxidoreductase [Pedobacter sp. SYP-B3415]